MFKYLLKGVLSAIAIKILINYRHLSIRLLKIEAAKAYLHGVHVARQSALGLMQMGLLIGLICVGVLLFHAGLFGLLPWTEKAKAILGLVLGLAYIAAGYIALRVGMDEKKWMEKSGASQMMRDATRQDGKN